MKKVKKNLPSMQKYTIYFHVEDKHGKTEILPSRDCNTKTRNATQMMNSHFFHFPEIIF